MTPPSPRAYCLFLNSFKYDRNRGCKAHDNAYGIHGGGGRSERLAADRALLAHMRARADPLALPVFGFVRLYGWIYFNYHRGLWRGQLVRRFRPGSSR